MRNKIEKNYVPIVRRRPQVRVSTLFFLLSIFVDQDRVLLADFYRASSRFIESSVILKK